MQQFHKFTLLPLEIRQEIYAIAGEDFSCFQGADLVEFTCHDKQYKIQGIGVIPEVDRLEYIPFLAPVTYASAAIYNEAVQITMQHIKFVITSSRSLRVFIQMLSRISKGFQGVRELHFEYVNQFSFDPESDGTADEKRLPIIYKCSSDPNCSAVMNKERTTIRCKCGDPPNADTLRTLDRFVPGAYPADLIDLLPRLKSLTLELSYSHLSIDPPLCVKIEPEPQERYRMATFDEYLIRTRIDQAIRIPGLRELRFRYTRPRVFRQGHHFNTLVMLEEWLNARNLESEGKLTTFLEAEYLVSNEKVETPFRDHCYGPFECKRWTDDVYFADWTFGYQ